ncbi:MerR family transcriptional regulator [Paracoccus sediminicola]|uniref:MerR family transcriptional regulator n=1 Tax=Paracoccus sediminicola TaxID=3017783 RepID=UPI0022F02D43|nr:MerR family DNA-binding transcriptional regulator [Paracoccus sediminicola]WBU58202.1 MerR family DNA-binding transcriptional regulator [Paracoccus sediminicola]
MAEDLMTIRQMCDAFDVTPRTLRFYESRELIAPERRGQHRFYDRQDRGRLKLILQGKRFGFSLEQIRQLLELYNPGEDNVTQLAATIDASRQRLADMMRQQEELKTAIIDLTQQIAEAERLLTERSDERHSA